MTNTDPFDPQLPGTAPLPPANRTASGTSQALLALVLMFWAVFLLLEPLGSSVFAAKFEEGVYPPGSASEVQSARMGVIAATALMIATSGLAISVIAARSHPVARLIGAITVLALAPTLLLLLLDYGLAF